MTRRFSGCSVAGEYRPGDGAEFTSENPARNFEAVANGNAASASEVNDAVAAAAAAFPIWNAIPYSARKERLLAVGDKLDAWVPRISEAITLEMGKPHREAVGEAKSILGKVKASALGQESLPNQTLPGAPGEGRWSPHGVVGVVGPYNYPVHLLNTHIMPALLAGNTVVFKPSEVTPWTGQLFGELLQELDLPQGVVNWVQGGGDVGAALSSHPDLGALCFTGSWATGRRILEANLDQPGKLLALEMGGKNAAIVLDDADLAQAVHEVVIGVCLTAGQRCTATSRVLVQRGISEAFREALVASLSKVLPGDPFDDGTVMGPLATRVAFDRYTALLNEFSQQGVKVLLPGQKLGGGFVSPSVFEREGEEGWSSYVKTELFGPNVALEVVDDADDAIERLASSPYGLSQSVFTRDEERFEHFVRTSRSGIHNWNRSTNNASGLLPFGGLGQSGNFRAAGAGSAQYCSYPVAVLKREPGQIDWEPRLGPLVQQVLGTAKGE